MNGVNRTPVKLKQRIHLNLAPLGSRWIPSVRWSYGYRAADRIIGLADSKKFLQPGTILPLRRSFIGGRACPTFGYSSHLGACFIFNLHGVFPSDFVAVADVVDDPIVLVAPIPFVFLRGGEILFHTTCPTSFTKTSEGTVQMTVVSIKISSRFRRRRSYGHRLVFQIQYHVFRFAGILMVMSYLASRNPRHTVIGSFRGILRLLYFAGVFFTCAIAVLFLRTVLPIPVYRRSRENITRKVGRILLYASNIRIRREGVQPPPGSLIVANHVSWADSFTFLSELGCRFMVNHLYGQIIGFGVLLRSVGVSFINRMSVKAIGRTREVMRTILRNGASLMVFPEGRTSRGETVRPFKSALLQVAVDLRRPVYWATVCYETDRSWPPASAVIGWEEWPPLLTHIYRAFHAPRITCRIRYGSNPVWAADRRSLATALNKVILENHRSMPQLPAETLRRIDVFKKVARRIVYGG